MRRIVSTLMLMSLFGGLLGCDRYEEDTFEEPIAEVRTPTEGTFVATVVNDKSVPIEGAAFFRQPRLNRYRLSLDFETQTPTTEGVGETGVFLSTTWKRKAEENLPSLGYANLVLSDEGSPPGKPTPWVVTGGDITLSLVTADRIEGAFRVVAQGTASDQQAGSVTIVGSFIALNPDP